MSEENNDKKKVGKSVNAGKPDVKGDKREEERRAKMKELLNPIDGTADKNAGPRKPNWRSILLYALILVVVVVAVGSAMQRQANENTVELATSEFVSAVEDGQVSEATYVAMTYTIKGEYWPEADKIGDENALVPFTSTYLGTDSLAELMASHPEVKYVADVSTTPTWVSLLTSMLPMLILIGVMVYFMNKFSDPTGGAMGFGKTKAQTTDATRPKVCFDDVAGCDEAIEELKEIKDYLDNPAKYQDLGAKIPHGVLLVGPPGTGKTLLAKAVAGEAGVPFFSIAGSEFVEMFVGMGASKVRDLFKQAGEKAPCIVFIDEIDTIGKKRDGGSNLGGNDEREQTLNQLLTEMDGFDATKGVVILAATNRPESLDPALTRPGRFDRRVPVELPDLKGRESILRLHAKKVKLGPDCDFGVVARMTPGASGAELANIVNEAALCAVRHHRKAVTQFDLQEAVDTILAGAQKKNKILNNKEKCIVSYHEVGHALVAALQTNSAPVQKITIVPRTSGALGFTMQVEDGDHTLMTKEEILNKIATLTGGRAAEELIFHSITTGASNDIEQATKLARALVTRYGMTEDFDMVALETVNNAYLGGDASLACSEQTAAQVDAKVVEIVQAEHKKAYKLLADNKRKLDEIAQYLYEKETISGEEFMRILNAQPQLPAGPSADSTNQAQ